MLYFDPPTRYLGRTVTTRMTPFLIFAVCSLIARTAGAAPSKFDVVILNGRVIDGSGAPWYRSDVGIRDGRIVAIGRLSSAVAKQRVDAAGRIVAPGFIDMLGQSELTIL